MFHTKTIAGTVSDGVIGVIGIIIADCCVFITVNIPSSAHGSLVGKVLKKGVGSYTNYTDGEYRHSWTG